MIISWNQNGSPRLQILRATAVNDGITFSRNFTKPNQIVLSLSVHSSKYRGESDVCKLAVEERWENETIRNAFPLHKCNKMFKRFEWTKQFIKWKAEVSFKLSQIRLWSLIFVCNEYYEKLFVFCFTFCLFAHLIFNTAFLRKLWKRSYNKEKIRNPKVSKLFSNFNEI